MRREAFRGRQKQASHPGVTDDQRGFFDWVVFNRASVQLDEVRGADPYARHREMAKDPRLVAQMLRDTFDETAETDWSAYTEPDGGLEGADLDIIANWLRDPDTHRDYAKRWLFAFGPVSLGHRDDVTSDRAYAKEKGLTLAEAKEVLAQFPGSRGTRRSRNPNPSRKLNSGEEITMARKRKTLSQDDRDFLGMSFDHNMKERLSGGTRRSPRAVIRQLEAALDEYGDPSQWDAWTFEDEEGSLAGLDPEALRKHFADPKTRRAYVKGYIYEFGSRPRGWQYGDPEPRAHILAEKGLTEAQAEKILDHFAGRRGNPDTSRNLTV